LCMVSLEFVLLASPYYAKRIVEVKAGVVAKEHSQQTALRLELCFPPLC